MEPIYFELETNGLCLFCRGRRPTLVSLQSLLNYLKIENKSVFAKVANSLGGLLELQTDCVRGALCPKCEQLLEKTLKVFEQLEALELKLSYYLGQMKGEIKRSEVGRSRNIRIGGGVGTIHSKIVKEIRKELVIQSSARVRKFPRVILERVDNSPRVLEDIPFQESYMDVEEDGINQIKVEVEDDPLLQLDVQKVEDAFQKGDETLQENGESAFQVEGDDGLQLESDNAHEDGLQVEGDDNGFHVEGDDELQVQVEGDNELLLEPSSYPSRLEPSAIFKSPNSLKFKCDLCDKQYSQKAKLKSHQMSVHEGIRINCPFCPHHFKSRETFNAHRLKFHSDQWTSKISNGKFKMGNFECSQCGLKLNHERSLIRHLSQVHLVGDDKKFKCSDCEKKFITKKSLQIHRETVHLGIRYPCQFCGILFTQEGIRSMHERKRCKNVKK